MARPVGSRCRLAAILENIIREPIAVGNKSPLDKREEQFAGLTCPDCSGPLMSSQDGEFLEFRCLIGHAYSPEAMRAAHLESVEEALWSAVASLREHSFL
jgi:hypothetical protein